jgi:riboflavin kinase/FMN adenylyltransferase
MRPSAVAAGTFDGLHIGHRYLINKLISVSRKKKLKSIIVTLSAPVRHNTSLLTSLDEKLILMKQFPVDEIIVLHTGPEITGLPAKTFFEAFLMKRLAARHIVVGKNFAFGHNREGDISWLKRECRKTGTVIDAVSPVKSGGEVVSSSRIRALLHEGNLASANSLLGRPYTITGFPVKGIGIGRTLGFPTVNLSVQPCKLLPMGVFAAVTRGRDGRLFPSVVNIGVRPTFFNKETKLLEIHLLGFAGRWPAVDTTVYLLKHLRAEKKFGGRKALISQIAKDVERTKAFFGGRQK